MVSEVSGIQPRARRLSANFGPVSPLVSCILKFILPNIYIKKKMFGCQASKENMQNRSEWQGFVRGNA